MPELPEVETIARQLHPLVQGKKITALEVLDPKLRSLEGFQFKGSEIIQVRRFEKSVAFVLKTPKGERNLLVHLRMTGRLLWSTPQGKTRLAKFVRNSAGDESGSKHLRFRLKLGDEQILFHDVRRFGTVKLLPTLESSALDPLLDELEESHFEQAMRVSKQPLKVFLLRQDLICGIGNIYASEILHAAGISPFRCGASLKDPEVQKLFSSIKKILQAAVKNGGTSFSDYQNALGEKGSYQLKLRVYQRENESCYTCGDPIFRAVQAARSSFYCPTCQKP